MARQPEVFVRELSPEEAQQLVSVARKSKNRVRMRRAGIVLASMQGRTVGEIAELFAASEGRVREVIHTFNERGFAALDPKWKGGRQAKTDRETRERICRIARCSPRSLGRPFSVWSLPKLRDYLAESGVVAAFSVETLRKILHAGGVSWQATKTWKASTDPDFADKMHRILALYDRPPLDGRVICADEFGPLNLQPRPGRSWFGIGQPARQRATYSRHGGVRHLFGGLDLASGQMFYRIRDHKRWQEFLDFLRQLRRRFPHGRLYLVCDNFGPHKKAEVATWCVAHEVELVYTPTNASWLNWIECEFTALRYFALDGTDHRSHTEQDHALGDYIRWRNQKAMPKRHLAVNSNIRRQDYLPNVA